MTWGVIQMHLISHRFSLDLEGSLQLSFMSDPKIHLLGTLKTFGVLSINSYCYKLGTNNEKQSGVSVYSRAVNHLSECFVFDSVL